jgi:hypothetical protein
MSTIFIKSTLTFPKSIILSYLDFNETIYIIKQLLYSCDNNLNKMILLKALDYIVLSTFTT